MEIVSVLLALVLLGVGGVLLVRIYEFIQIFFEKNNAAVPDAEHPITLLAAQSALQKHIPFYARLDAASKQEFIRRTEMYLSRLRIVGMDNFVLTTEARVLAVAPAVQLTWGIADFVIERIQTIGIYPGIFWSEMIRREVKGLTFSTGLCIFLTPICWPDLIPKTII